MSPVFDVFMFDDAITSSPSSTGPVGDLRLFPDLALAVVPCGPAGMGLGARGSPHEERRAAPGVPAHVRPAA